MQAVKDGQVCERLVHDCDDGGPEALKLAHRRLGVGVGLSRHTVVLCMLFLYAFCLLVGIAIGATDGHVLQNRYERGVESLLLVIVHRVPVFHPNAELAHVTGYCYERKKHRKGGRRCRDVDPNR